MKTLTFLLLTLMTTAALATPSQYLYVLKLAPRLHDDNAWTEADIAATGEHFRYLRRATERGQLLLAGRTQEPGATTQGLVIFEAANENAAREFMNSDPAVITGIMTATLHPYAVALGHAAPTAAENDVLIEQVRATERAFAATLAERDFEAFGRFVAADAVFLNNGDPLHGKEAILEHWARFFEGETASFAWDPEWVVVLENGTLAQTNGPVTDAEGKVIARFQSVWRRQTNGDWKVVFDNGYAVVPPP